MKEFGGQGNRGKPREKIRGSQFWKREEKNKPKSIIRNPFDIWKKKKLPNRINRLDNLNHAHGVYVHGVYYDHGRPQRNKSSH